MSGYVSNGETRCYSISAEWHDLFVRSCRNWSNEHADVERARFVMTCNMQVASLSGGSKGSGVPWSLFSLFPSPAAYWLGLAESTESSKV